MFYVENFYKVYSIIKNTIILQFSLKRTERCKDIHFTDECMLDTNSLGFAYAWVSKEEVDYSKKPTKIRFL